MMTSIIKMRSAILVMEKSRRARESRNDYKMIPIHSTGSKMPALNITYQ